MAFQQGLSGLFAAGRALDVTSNNIANTATVGFKSSRSNFADVYGASMTAGSNTLIGIGVNLAAVQQQFEQGNFSKTNNPLDLAINGSGFFRVVAPKSEVDPGAVVEAYTRNGQFHLDNAGYIVNDFGQKLVGVVADANGNIPDPSANNTGPINVTRGVGAPAQTTSAMTKANLDGNAIFPKDVTDPTGLTQQNPPADFSDPDDPNWSKNWYTNARSLDVYDSQGGAHSLTYYFVKQNPNDVGGPNVWNVYATLADVAADGSAIVKPAVDPSGANPDGLVATLTFNANGTLSTPTATVPIVFENINTNDNNIPAVEDISIEMDFLSMTQFKSPFAVDSMRQDGYAKGNLAGLSVSQEGIVQARYDNGKISDLGRIVLYTFENPNGLMPVGNTQWVSTAASGPPNLNLPTVGNAGQIQSSSVEDSNVDLTQELVNLIVQQRNYQANAQSIKTQDQVLQTLVNLR